MFTRKLGSAIGHSQGVGPRILDLTNHTLGEHLHSRSLQCHSGSVQCLGPRILHLSNHTLGVSDTTTLWESTFWASTSETPGRAFFYDNECFLNKNIQKDMFYHKNTQNCFLYEKGM